MNSINNNSIFSYQDDYSTNMYGSLFGSNSTSNSGMFSLTSSLGDLSMINKGVYKMALKSYYAKTDTKDKTESITQSGTTDSKAALSTMKSAATKLKSAADALKKKNYSKVEKPSDMLDSVKSFVNSYNSTISAAKNLNSYSILQTAVWGTEQMNSSEAMLNKVGITIKEDNTLAIDEEKFAEADMSTLKALFSGSGSLVDRISGKASSLALQSANQLAVNSGKTIYTASGTIS